jgi:hypothetical protein
LSQGNSGFRDRHEGFPRPGTKRKDPNGRAITKKKWPM